MNLDFNILVFLTSFIFALPILGYLFRFNIPISIFFLLAGTFMIAIFLSTDGIILGYDEILNNESPIYSVNHPMNVTTSASSVAFSATITGLAERPANINSVLINKQINCIEINMLRTGNPTGNVMIGILDNDNRMVKLFGNVTASSVNTGTRSYQTCLPNHDYWIIAYNDYVGAKHTGSVGADNIAVSLDATNPFDGTNSVRATYTSGLWSDTIGTDLRMKLTTENLVINKDISQEPNVMDFTFTGENYQIKVFMIFIAIMFMVGGALVEVKQR